MTSSFQTRRASWHIRYLAYVCLILFAIAGFAETAHFHTDVRKAPNEQHCSLCIAGHSVARPTLAASLAVAPSLCVSILVIDGTLIPVSRWTLSLYIRPPPTA